MPKKGTRGEYDLRDVLEERGFAILRSPASGSIGYRINEDGEKVEREAPDVLAGDGENVYFFECKWNSEPPIYIEKGEMEDLEYVGEKFCVDEVYAAIRYDREDWYFIKKEDMHETEKSYRAEGFKPKEALTASEL